ncbi:hypothetical protein KOR42_34280 [Thalassoglobus neptunius]|uniref:Replication-relaxation n=1 Tax=Thalassoglobus neptunius TaxID=1938619 RepID=A0A5C5WNP1_9PLAN|nr:replication-relaxation family protein [Thalassoglobus neptunius]TWT51741.1 hypothetical protein KOR42_34280 [Thalassoglobus neptunius]
MARRGNSKGIPGIRLQDRDLDILRELGQVLWMDTRLIQCRHFHSDRTGEATRRRLRVLAANRIIESFDLQVTIRPGDGRMPRFHRLLPYAAELLVELTGVPPTRLLTSSPPKPHTVQHRAGMGETLLRFEDAREMKSLPESKWFLEYDRSESASGKSPFHERFTICYSVLDNGGKSHRVWPDALSSLNVPMKGQVSQLVLAWEFDRGTETLKQIVEKLDPYALWIASRGYREQFPSSVDVRVCFVLPSMRRLKSVIEATNMHPVAKFLRFVSFDEFTADRILSEPIWYDANGLAKRILPS